MIDSDKYTQLLQWHNGVELFDYDQVVDWSMHNLECGIETEHMLILASFSKPVTRDEIKPYVTGALRDLGLEEKYGSYSVLSQTHYYLEQILDDYEIRAHLRRLYELCMKLDFDKELINFYKLYHAWIDLETEGHNFYYEEATLENIELILKEEAQKWIDTHIHGKTPISTLQTSQKKINKK